MTRCSSCCLVQLNNSSCSADVQVSINMNPCLTLYHLVRCVHSARHVHAGTGPSDLVGVFFVAPLCVIALRDPPHVQRDWQFYTRGYAALQNRVRL